MSAFHFDLIPLGDIDTRTEYADTDWVWRGYLARGNITLFTSRWKSGKTTLVAGLLRALAGGGTFLGKACQPAKVVVASEESVAHWRDRNRTIPIGSNVCLLSRPFAGRPTVGDWNVFVTRAQDLRDAGDLDLFVVDPLATFLPGLSDSDPGTLLAMLLPLRRLATSGVAVLILHHPRKASSEEGSTARGGGALLGFVDIILELGMAGKLPGDVNRRRVFGMSRHADTPKEVVYEWTPGTPEFEVVADPHGATYRENWADLRDVLGGLGAAVTHRELLAAWPVEKEPPTVKQLYGWLSRAAAEKVVVRTGRGTKFEPYRFRLPRYADAFTLPPLE